MKNIWKLISNCLYCVYTVITILKMILSISNISGEPLQSQLIRQIKAQILSGILPAGFPMPSIRALAKEQKVSVITIQRAYDALERDKLIASMPAKGFYVCEISKENRIDLAKLNFSEKLNPLIASAKNEGLNQKELLDIFENEIKNIY